MRKADEGELTRFRQHIRADASAFYARDPLVRQAAASDIPGN
jgi:hypothetical protein